MPLPESLQQYEEIISSRPNLKLFLNDIQNGKIDPLKISQFKTWMSGKKFTEDLRPVSEALLSMAEKALEAKNASGKQPTPKQTTGAPPSSKPGKGGPQKGQPVGSNQKAAKPDVYGEPFHNPYTFIPFPDHAPERHKPTPLSMDEIETDRMTGVMDITIKTRSPLLSTEDKDKNAQQQGIQLLKARRIGRNCFVPASSMRGVLRTLTGIISGSALDYIDDNLWLCQGRDLQLSGPGKKIYLAKIVKAGDAYHDGIVRFGEARLVKDSALNIDHFRKEYDGTGRDTKELWIDDPDCDNPDKAYRYDPSHPYRVKVSGRKVNSRGIPHEGAFKQEEAREITLRKELWLDYQGRNRHGIRPELRNGDLVWLQPYNDEEGIQDGGQVKSIQWARWGREGKNFKEQLTKHGYGYMLPDYLKEDGLVDITSDLFGSVPVSSQAYSAFAGRVRPDNLVFVDNTGVTPCEMAPLSSPHPGCVAFYMDNDNLDEISLEDLPKGYKVYRTTKERGEKAPWNYSEQPIFDQAVAKPFSAVQKMTHKAELVNEGSVGHFKLSFRSLTKEEFALLLLVLSCDLRIGGGKPFGLGHAVVTQIDAYDENGDKILDYAPKQKASVPPEYADAISSQYLDRANKYCKTQEPVDKLRYPRTMNDKGNQKGGMCWFALHASVRKNTSKGLGTQWVSDYPDNEALDGLQQIRAQGLPRFDPLNPAADMLFGYDVGFRFEQAKDKRNMMKDFKKDGFKNESFQRYGNDSQNRESRQWNRDNRK